MAIENDVHVVGASSLAAGHNTLVPELIGALKEAGVEDIQVVVGGIIPPKDYEQLYQAGVACIFGPGTPVTESANQVLNALESAEIMKPSDPQLYVEGVRARDRRLLSKTITLVESALAPHQELARQILDQLMPFSGKALRLGITGVPGVGKSTFIESLGMFLVNQGHRLAVLAVDPSSARSGGSVMADKTRMEQLATHPRAFIRPSPAGETLGGVARKTRETMLICEAAGYDVIIVETVGSGPIRDHGRFNGGFFSGFDAGRRRRRASGHQKRGA